MDIEAGGAGDWAFVLERDRALAAALPASARRAAQAECLTRVVWIPAGAWDPGRTIEERAGELGLLILEGFLARHASVVGRPSAELLGPGDLLRPWEPDRTAPFSAGSRWEVLVPCAVSVLDRRFARVAGHWPELIDALLGRASARSRELALSTAVGQLSRIDVRLLVALWHLGRRWGSSHDGGTLLPMRLTHQLLATLTSASRPRVTHALVTLRDRGLVERRPDGLFLLRGACPTELHALQHLLAPPAPSGNAAQPDRSHGPARTRA